MATDDQDLDTAVGAVIHHHHDVHIDVSVDRSGYLIVSRIVVPADARNEGTGTQVMAALCDIADRFTIPMALTPTSDFGGSKRRLVGFYQRFGFVPNRGPGRDLTVRETMIRQPRPR